MLTRTELQLSHGINYKKAEIMTDEIEWITTRQAAKILDVSGRQGVHYILNHLPEDAPKVRSRTIDLGGASILQLVKADVELLREYRNSIKP